MAEEEVTDLTEEEGPAEGADNDKGKKKDKKEKKEKKPKDEKEPKVKAERKGGSLGVIILMILVIILLVGGFGVALFFDALGARIVVGDAINDPLLDVVAWLDPDYQTIVQRLRAEALAQEERFAAREADMDARDEEIIERELMLETMEAQVIRRENEIVHREAQLQAMLDRAVPLHRRPDMTEQEFEDMLSLSATYAQMAPEIAANILVTMHDPRDVAGLLYHMAERERAAIMSVMEPRFAAHITEILLYY